MSKATITERGWAGHFIASRSCYYHRNTLIEKGDKRIVVSTVGNYHPSGGEVDMIGMDRYYETMAFEAHKEGVYWEADVTKEVGFTNKWAIDHAEEETDLEAYAMHEAVVKEIVGTL